MLKKWVLSATLIALSVLPVKAVKRETGHTIYVNNDIGNDTYSGRHSITDGNSGPVKTLKRALELATLGSRIELAQTGIHYRETFLIEGFNLGKAGQPLIIEGNGATVSGLLRIPASEWKLYKDDIYYIDMTVLKKLSPLAGMPKSNWLWHWKRQSWWHEKEAPNIFFLNGKPANHSESLETIESEGFFYNINKHPVHLYFRPGKGKKITDYLVDFPANRGVIINDDHIVIRNLASIYSSDDGFSTFLAASAVFHNVYGAYNCDQGLSLHNSTSGLIEGSIFEYNGGCGIADVMNTQSTYIQTVIRHNMVAGMWLNGSSHNILSCFIVDNRGPQAVICKDTRADFINSVICGQSRIDQSQIGIDIQGLAFVDHCTLTKCSTGLKMSGECRVSNSILMNCSDALISHHKQRVSIFNSLLDPSGLLDCDKSPVKAKSLVSNPIKQIKNCYVDMALPEDFLSGLPETHPLFKKGQNGTRIGASIKPSSTWNANEKIEIIPITLFTHNCGRKKQ